MASSQRDVNGAPPVGVVITTFDHAHFLGEAIESVLAQDRAAAEILVVDDGSRDDPAAVAGRYPSVTLIRQANQGLAAARNAGLRESTAEKVIFLDADDRLLPHAVTAGLECFADAPSCGFVYGGFRRISTRRGRPLSENYFNPIGADPYRDFLNRNVVGMHAAVMYDRGRLIAAGGFDSTLRRCEDYELYLRMSRLSPIASHPNIVAEYHWHGANMSANHREQLYWALRVHCREAQRALAAPDTARDWRRGQAWWRDFYVGRMLSEAKTHCTERRAFVAAAREVTAALTAAPVVVARHTAGFVQRQWGRVLPSRAVPFRPDAPLPGASPRGSIDFGSFDRVEPVSRLFGYDRGTPIDRCYVEQFLDRYSTDIGGNVLEVGGDTYCRRFGAARITRQDVLDLCPANAAATIVGDLSVPHTLPAAEFDCIVLIQTLQFVFDVGAAVAEIHRALKPGGIVLLTVPGISPIDRAGSRAPWCWSFSSYSAARLFSELFGGERVDVESFGNVFAATAFLQGLAVEEVDRSRLQVPDPDYPIIVGVRARKGPV